MKFLKIYIKNNNLNNLNLNNLMFIYNAQLTIHYFHHPGYIDADLNRVPPRSNPLFYTIPVVN